MDQNVIAQAATILRDARAFGLASYASAGAVIHTLKQRLAQEKTLAKTVKSIILDLTS